MSSNDTIWTESSEFDTYRLCEQRRFRRACASGSGSHLVQASLNLRCSLIEAVNQEEPSDRKPDPWPLWMAGHAQLKFVMTECSKTQIRLTGLIWSLVSRLNLANSFLFPVSRCSHSSIYYYRSSQMHLYFMFVISGNRKSNPCRNINVKYKRYFQCEQVCLKILSDFDVRKRPWAISNCMNVWPFWHARTTNQQNDLCAQRRLRSAWVGIRPVWSESSLRAQ